MSDKIPFRADQVGSLLRPAELKDAREKKRRQNAKRPWGVKQRMLDSKKRRGAIKKLRSGDW